MIQDMINSEAICSKVVCTVLCWHRKIVIEVLATSAETSNKIRLNNLENLVDRRHEFVIKAFC